MRIVSRLRLRAHTIAVESSIWRGGNGHCDKCFCAAQNFEQAVQNEVHVFSHCQDLFVCSRKKVLVPFLPFLQILFYEGPPKYIFHMPCLVRLSLIFFLNGTMNSAI